MAQQPRPQSLFQRIKLLKTEELGVGSYGAVYKAVCDDLLCAAKIFHRSLFQFTTPGAASVMRKFEQECHLLSAIKHPHIVQYLGTYCDPESRLPVLLMELMDESLTRFLERSHEPLPYHTEVNLCHDIALALSYLHSIGIIHRNLSSNNVLLIACSRAKVTDFGMVKPYDTNHSTAHLTPLTLCPDTGVYTSPEALRDQPVYTDKLDSFSFGVLCIQIMTRKFPNPGSRIKNIEINDPRANSGAVQVEVLEIERRQSHINMIDPTHPLLPVVLDCIKDRDSERPSCHELCSRMSTLKASSKYTESVQRSQVNTKPTQSASREREIPKSQQIQDFQQQLDALRDQVYIKDDQLQDKEQETQQQHQQILRLRHLLTATSGQLQKLQQQLVIKEKQLAGKEHQLQQKEATIAEHQQVIQQLRQQLEKVIAEFQKHLLEREKQERAETRGGRGCGAAVNAGSNVGWGDGRRVLCEEWEKVTADVTVPEILHEDMNLSTVKHTPIVTDTYYYIDNDYYSTSVPERGEGKDSSSVKVRKAHGYESIDLSESEEDIDKPCFYNVDLSEGKDSSSVKVRKAHGYESIDLSESEEDIDKPCFYNVDLSEHLLSTDEKNLLTVKHPPMVTDAHGFEVVPKMKEKGGQKKAGPFNLVHIDESSIIGSAQIEREPHLYTKVLDCDDDALSMLQLDSTVESSTKGHEQLDQEPANDAATQLKEVKSKAPPPIPPQNLPPKPPPYHKGDLSMMLGSSVPPPLPKCNHPKPSLTDKSTSTTTLEGKVTKILKGEVFQPPSCPPPLPPPYRLSSPLSPTISASPPHRTSPPPLPPQMSPSDKAQAFQLSQAGPPSFPDLSPMSGSSVPLPLPIKRDHSKASLTNNLPEFEEGKVNHAQEDTELKEAECYLLDVPESGEDADHLGYHNIDVPEDMNLSTGEHALVAERPGYYNVDFPEGKNHFTVDHFPVTETSGYYNVELPEQSTSKVEKNLLTVKHPSVATDVRGYYNIDIPELSPPEENLATIKHPPIVIDAHGYYNLDPPELF